ncbi:MFS transporter [Neobacillus terrae]|uniref:MFS transporter n=1 Tax=Neobacillus terrae TaxID=3034837 RepID=UPI00140BD999|nr:MFS transporter [Neobacillus terrae]NHM30196.1 MFS transporter [Neobacillus terrae]
MQAVAMNASNPKEQIEKRNLYLFSAGKTISIVGTSIYNFALSLYVLKITGSALSFAITLMLGVIPMILINPFAGVIADKFNKKRLVLSMDALNGLLLALVYGLSMIYELHLYFIYAATFCLTVFTTFYGVGLEAAKPNMVSGDRLMNINSASRIIDSIATIAGPMLGGIVFAIFDIRLFILFNSVSFILSAISAGFIDFSLYQENMDLKKERVKVQFFADIKDGFIYLKNQKNMIQLFKVLISINFFLGFALTVPLPYMVNTVLSLSPKQFGIIEAAFPLGMIAGALAVKRITETLNYSVLLYRLCIFLAGAMVLIGIPVLIKDYYLNHQVIVGYFCLVMFIFGVIIAFIDIPIAYYMQKMIPDEYRGRVLSIGISIGKTMLPLAMLTAGMLLSHIPSYVMPIAGGALFFLLNIRTGKKLEFDLNK